jgi:aspartate aminotransferase
MPMRPDDPILGIKKLYAMDTSPNKVDLGVGVFNLPDGSGTYIPPPVESAKEIIRNQVQDHNYLGSTGNANMCRLTGELIYGDMWENVVDNVSIVQSISGTGALRLGAEFLKDFFIDRTVYCSDPTWSNHYGVFQSAGLKTATYPYYNPETITLNLDALLNAIRSAPSGSVFIFHACAHNPTGVDPTKEEWKLIADAVVENQIIPFFDGAYIGFATGSIEDDAYAIRLFASLNITSFLAQSFAKNFGIYGERVGTFSIYSTDPNDKPAIMSQLTYMIRVLYSNPPKYGSRIVEIILNDPQLKQDWLDSLRYVGDKIKHARQTLYDGLIQRGTPGEWGHILRQIGMFSYTGLNVNRVKAMTSEFHIYLLSTGRINVLGITDDNVNYVADAIDWVIRNVQ